MSLGSIAFEDEEVKTFYDFFFPEDPTQKAMLDSIFSDQKLYKSATKEETPSVFVSVVSECEGDEALEPFCILGENDDDDQSQSEHHTFPWTLHVMLEDAERDNFEHIVSWVDDGTAFKVHDSKEFVTKVMPNYFDQTRYESFRRQLNLYGFARYSKGRNRGIISHSCLIKSDFSLCGNITRKPKKMA
jgi:hypothetical protein